MLPPFLAEEVTAFEKIEPATLVFAGFNHYRGLASEAHQIRAGPLEVLYGCSQKETPTQAEAPVVSTAVLRGQQLNFPISLTQLGAAGALVE